MRKLTLLLVLPALMLCGFAPAGEEEKPQDPPAPAKPRRDGMDMTQMMIDNMKEAMYWVAVHAEPKAGQYWESGFEMSGMKNTSRWQVSKVEGKTAIVEQIEKSNADWGGYEYVIAYEVDLSKAAGEANVTKAWIGMPGGDGKSIGVMKKPEGPVEVPEAPKAESKVEDFTDIELAGRKWSGKLTTTTYGETVSKVWVADNGWFGKMVKMQSGEVKVELKSVGEDAKASLKLPGGKAAEGKNEEGKKDEKEEKTD